MTGKTHRVGGMLCVLGGYTLLESKGMLLGNVSPILQLTVMYPFAIYGSIASDLDHDWHSCPSKDVVSLAINKILHLTSGIVDRLDEKSLIYKVLSIFDANHRSWQTHSDLFLIAMIITTFNMLNSSIGSVDAVIIRLIATGLILGVISHLVLDMLTPEGIWSISTTFLGWLLTSKFIGKIVTHYSIRKSIKQLGRAIPQKISLVPDTKFFRTGGVWEKLIRKVLWVICLLLFLKIVYSMSPYSLSFFKG